MEENDPIFNYFPLHGMVSFKQTIYIIEVFHFKTPHVGFPPHRPSPAP